MLEIKLFHVPISGGPFSKTLMYTKASAPQSVHVLNCTFPAICKCFLYYFLFTLTSTVPLQFMSFQLRNKRLALNQKRNKDTNCDSSHFNNFLFFIFIFLNETRTITGKKSADAWRSLSGVLEFHLLLGFTEPSATISLKSGHLN